MQLTNLKTHLLGKHYEFYKEIDSTQNEIWRRINENNIKNGTVISAGIQTQGKGTHGRIWHTDEPNNVAFSMYIETNCNINCLDGITVEFADSITNIMREKYNIYLDVKKPNDLMYNGKKVGGILTESKVNLEKVKFLIIGIGINTNKQNFTQDIENIATSIKKEFGTEIEEEELITEICNEFEKIIMKKIKLQNDNK
mgnify:FL=1